MASIRRRPRALAVVVSVAGLLTAQHLETPLLGPADAAATTVVINGQDHGRTFDGVGAVSAGGSSRLLLDYPEPERGRILDYLFTPNFGASLDILKVEIGAEVDATVGAEPSHAPMRGQVDCHRGYEWWLMDEARKRNPDIAFYGLMWGAPGWFDGGIWSSDHIDYLISWLDCARANGFTIDYLGGANESGWDRDFYVDLAAALDADGFADVQVVATDNHSPPDYYAAATQMAGDPAFARAVDILGEHDVCGWRTLQTRCNANDDALNSGKALWDSENSTQDYDIGAEPLARAMNRHYIDKRITGNLNWALIASWYGSFPLGGTGLMLADRPWSGWYDVGPEIWVDAQTTQFTAPGWQYLDGASGYTPGGGSYVSLRSPTTGDFTVVAETMDLTEPETVRFRVTGGLSTGALTSWSTNLATRTGSDDFSHDGTIVPSGGEFSVTLQPGRVYTFSTTRGQAKGSAKPRSGPEEQLRMPFRQTFGGLRPGALAPYFADVHGGFEAAPCTGGRRGVCYQQTVLQEPSPWHGVTMPATTVVGDPLWWGDYEVSVDALLDQPGYVELLGRVESQQHRVAGYHLKVEDTGAWALLTENAAGQSATLASGSVPALGLRTWHRLALRFRGDQVTVLLDRDELATVQDDSHTSGQVGLRVGGWQRAQFDNLVVSPTNSAPRFVPHAEMTATATSEQGSNYFGHSYPARHAIDDRVDSAWRSEFEPARPLPQSLTLDLGRERVVRGVTYRPMVTGVPTGAITAYDIAVSDDGQRFETVASGTWEATIATKVASIPRTTARYVQLTATDSAGCPKNGVAAEVNVATSPVRELGQGPPPDPGEPGTPGFDHLVPQSQLRASATSQQPGYEAAAAVDGNCATMWHTSWTPYQPPPQSLTLDLGGEYQSIGLLYHPRQDGTANGIVTDYTILVSGDGTNFTEVASGTWAVDASIKAATWPATAARYVRLLARNGAGGYVSAAELNIGYEP